MLGDNVPEALRDLDVVLVRLVEMARSCDDITLDRIIRMVDETLGKLVYIQWGYRYHEKVKESNDNQN